VLVLPTTGRKEVRSEQRVLRPDHFIHENRLIAFYRAGFLKAPGVEARCHEQADRYYDAGKSVGRVDAILAILASEAPEAFDSAATSILRTHLNWLASQVAVGNLSEAEGLH
jgi:hypothetical protein